ncbi:MAG TPA: tetratricopeptide repeat protein, partial [Candidatus Obscuribacterales bacterium]
MKRLFLVLAFSVPLAMPQALGAPGPTMSKAVLERYYQGIQYFKAGDLDKALAALKLVALSAPSDPLVHLALAAALQQHGDIDDAIAEYRRAIA